MRTQKMMELLLEQGYISTLLNKKMDTCLSVHGLSFTEFVIMFKLHKTAGGAMSRISLAESVGLTASGITRLLLPMEKNNIIVKTSNPRDARQSLVALSSVGEQLFNDSFISMGYSCESVFSLFEDNEIDVLLGLLNKIKY